MFHIPGVHFTSRICWVWPTDDGRKYRLSVIPGQDSLGRVADFDLVK